MSLLDNSSLIHRSHLVSFEKPTNMCRFNTSKSYSPFLSSEKLLGIHEVLYCASAVSYLEVLYLLIHLIMNSLSIYFMCDTVQNKGKHRRP